MKVGGVLADWIMGSPDVVALRHRCTSDCKGRRVTVLLPDSKQILVYGLCRTRPVLSANDIQHLREKFNLSELDGLFLDATKDHPSKERLITLHTALLHLHAKVPPYVPVGAGGGYKP